MATGSHRMVNVSEVDTVVISATPVPGNEKLIGRTINHLFQVGADVVTKDINLVHVSGHANQEEIKLIIGLTRPKFLIPHHGEIRHQHAFRKLAMLMGYANNQVAITKIGSKVVLTDEKMVLAERVESGSVYVDGLGIGDVGEIVLRDRQQLSRDGVVVVVAVLSKGHPTTLVYGPEITSRGFTFMKEAEELVEEARKVARTSLETQLQKDNWEWGALRGSLQESLNRYFWEKTRRNPMILPVLLRF